MSTIATFTIQDTRLTSAVRSVRQDLDMTSQLSHATFVRQSRLHRANFAVFNTTSATKDQHAHFLRYLLVESVFYQRRATKAASSIVTPATPTALGGCFHPVKQTLKEIDARFSPTPIASLPAEKEKQPAGEVDPYISMLSTLAKHRLFATKSPSTTGITSVPLEN